MVTALLTLMVGNPVTAQADDAATPADSERDVSGGGTAAWALNAVVPVPINIDNGAGKQDTATSYAGDLTCRCIGWDFFGMCNSYFGAGDWKVKWYNTRWEGAHSRLTIQGTVTENVYHVQAASRGYLGEACSLPLQGAYVLGQGIAQLTAKTFHDISGKAAGFTQVGVSVPLTGASVAVPGLLFYTSGTASWSGSAVHWDFDYRGTAAAVSPTVVLPASSITVNAQSLA